MLQKSKGINLAKQFCTDALILEFGKLRKTNTLTAASKLTSPTAAAAMLRTKLLLASLAISDHRFINQIAQGQILHNLRPNWSKRAKFLHGNL